MFFTYIIQTKSGYSYQNCQPRQSHPYQNQQLENSKRILQLQTPLKFGSMQKESGSYCEKGNQPDDKCRGFMGWVYCV